MYKNLYVSADSNVKKINFELRDQVSCQNKETIGLTH